MSERPLSERIRALMGWFDPEFAPQAQVVNGLANEVRDLEAPAPQIVRTPADLEALDPDTVVLDGIGETYPVRAFLDAGEYEKQIFERYLPAVVVRDGAGVRACREALGGENE